MPASITRSRRAVSLLEIVVSMTAFAVILLAGLSAVTLVTRAASVDETGAGTHIDMRPELDMIEAEIAFAKRIISFSSTSVQYTVPDQNGDGEDETIVLAWAGKAGAPLTRSVNGSAPADLVPGVGTFSMSLVNGAVNEAASAGESGEQLVYSSPSGAVNGSLAITDTAWSAVTCVPQAIAGATGYRVTRVRVRMSGEPPLDGKVTLRLYQATATALIQPMLHEVVFGEETLGDTMRFADIYLTHAPILPAGSRIALVVGASGSGTIARLATQSNSQNTNLRSVINSSNAGSTWSADTSRELFYQVYARPMFKSVAATSATTALALRFTLAPHDSRVPPIDRTVLLRNRPALP
ncbi:MAG: hypothetical protein KF859_05220 [Phycisphaeraceae bacterium]|nr:hypothetical protein [Phycisphaeraceae bacterium]